MRQSIFIACALWLVVGCTTTPEVLELAKATAINAGLLTQELQQFADDEKRFARSRTAHVQELENSLAQARERFELDRMYSRETEDDEFVQTERRLNEFIAKVDKVREDARASLVLIPEVETVSVDERVKELAVLAKSMAELAEPPDNEQNLQFLKNYVESVRDHVEKATGPEEADVNAGQNTLTEVHDAKSGRTPNEGGEK